jgi:hypothetical protein
MIVRTYHIATGKHRWGTLVTTPRLAARDLVVQAHVDTKPSHLTHVTDTPPHPDVHTTA